MSRRFIAGFSILAATIAVGCLTTPGDPGSSASAITCPANQGAFNGTCHDRCATTASCTGNDACTVVAKGLTLCVPPTTCAYLGDDSVCGMAGAAGYDNLAYGSGAYGNGPYGNGPYDNGEYNGNGADCIGNAVWQPAPDSTTSDPQCGHPHVVQRCRLLGGTCVLATEISSDIGE